jgi:hypothetical protein
MVDNGDAHYSMESNRGDYTEGVKQGGILFVARVDDERAAEVATILRKASQIGSFPR